MYAPFLYHNRVYNSGWYSLSMVDFRFTLTLQTGEVRNAHRMNQRRMRVNQRQVRVNQRQVRVWHLRALAGIRRGVYAAKPRQRGWGISGRNRG